MSIYDQCYASYNNTVTSIGSSTYANISTSDSIFSSSISSSSSTFERSTILQCMSDLLEGQLVQKQQQLSSSSSLGGTEPVGDRTNSNNHNDDDDTRYVPANFTYEDQYSAVLLVYAAAMVLFMQAGFAMICAGSVRKKNIQNTMLKNLLDACGASLAFYAIGFAFAFGGDANNNYYAITDIRTTTTTFIGTSQFFLKDVTNLSHFIFQYVFSATSATIVAGALAERCQMAAYLAYSIVLSGWVYPVVVHSIWSSSGFLSAMNQSNNNYPLWGTGVIDFAGAGVVHITGGITALFAAMILGPRRGRFHDDSGNELEVPKNFIGSSVALQLLGTFILWFGWYAFNTGNAYVHHDLITASKIVGLVGVNTTLSAGVGGIISILANVIYLDRTTGESFFDVKYAMNGTLCGLVAITSGCAVFEPYSAVFVGIAAGLGYNLSSRLLTRYRIDDAVDAVPVHLCGGILGMIMTGLLAVPSKLELVYGRSNHVGLFYSIAKGEFDLVLLCTQFIGILFIIGWVCFFMIPFFIWLDFMGWFRSDPLEEIVGLDLSYHGGFALQYASAGHENGEVERVSPEHISEFTRLRTEAKQLRQRVLSVPSTAKISFMEESISNHPNNNNHTTNNGGEHDDEQNTNDGNGGRGGLDRFHDEVEIQNDDSGDTDYGLRVTL